MQASKRIDAGRRSFVLRTGGLAAAAALAPGLSLAKPYPDHSITLVVPYASGGQTDTMARVLASKLGAVVNGSVVVENRGGGTGSIAARMVAHAHPDGYMLLFGSGGPMSINPVLHNQSFLGYDPVKDFTPVAYIANSPNIIAANPSFPAKTVADLVAYAKAHPGEVGIGSTTGSEPDMMSLLFGTRTGIDYRRVPYPSGAPLMVDVIGGHVPVLIDGIISVQPQVVTKKLNAIAVSSAQRLPSLPDVPTVSETIPGFVSNSWFSVFAPAGTPRDVVMSLNKAINKVLAMPEVKEQYLSLGAVVAGGPPEVLRDHLSGQLAQWRKLVKDTGIKVE